MLSFAFLYLAAVNALTVLAFWHDKRCAVSGRRRVRERHLLQLAAFGGMPGALLARRWFRHKTRKQPFSSWLVGIAAVQGAVAAGLLFHVLTR